MDRLGIAFKWKDYRAKGLTRHKSMTLVAEDLIRRLLLHILPAELIALVKLPTCQSAVGRH